MPSRRVKQYHAIRARVRSRSPPRALEANVLKTRAARKNPARNSRGQIVRRPKQRDPLLDLPKQECLAQLPARIYVPAHNVRSVCKRGPPGLGDARIRLVIDELNAEWVAGYNKEECDREGLQWITYKKGRFAGTSRCRRRPQRPALPRAPRAPRRR